MITYEQYAKAQEEVYALTMKPSLSVREVQKQNGLLAFLSSCKGQFSPEQVRSGERDRLLKAAGLPKLPDSSHYRGFNPEADREYREIGLGRARATRIPDDREVRVAVENPPAPASITYTQPVAGGTFVPSGMYSRVFESMKQYDELFDPQFSNIIETETGNQFPFPALDDVGASASQVGEAAQSSDGQFFPDPNFGTLELNAWAFRSTLIRMSRELLLDSNFPISMVLERAFAIQLARGIGAALVNGTGLNQPTGLVTGLLAAGASVVVAAGSSSNTGGIESGTTSIGTDDIGNLIAKLDPAYRRNAVFAMNDGTYQYLLRLKDKQGRPVWPTLDPSPRADNPTIWGHPIALCPSFPTLGSKANVVAYYSPFYFIQRRVPSSCYLRVLDERFADFHEVAFQMWMRADSGVVAPNPNFVPGAVLQCHS